MQRNISEGYAVTELRTEKCGMGVREHIKGWREKFLLFIIIFNDPFIYSTNIKCSVLLWASVPDTKTVVSTITESHCSHSTKIAGGERDNKQTLHNEPGVTRAIR